MKKLTTLVVLILFTHLFAQTEASNFVSFKTFNKGLDEIPTESWQIQNGKDWQTAVFPVYEPSKNRIKLRALFEIPSRLDSLPVQLIVQGVSGNCTVYLNGQAVGVQSNHSAPFILEVPFSGLIEKNLLELHISKNKQIDTGFPDFTHIYKVQPFIGIKQKVSVLVKTPKIISDFKAEIISINSKAEVEYSYQLNLPDSKLRYRIDETFMPMSKKRARFVSSKVKNVTAKTTFNLDDLWNADNPKQIHLTVQITNSKQNSFTEDFYFTLSQIQFKNNNLYYNNSRVTIKGINYHNDGSRFIGKNYFRTLIQDLKNIKENGFNSIRLPHYLPDDRLLYTADSLGLMVFAELPVQRYPQPLFFNDNLLEHSKDAIKELTKFTQKHPSFCAIGLGQEVSLQNAATQKFMLILKDFVGQYLKVPTYTSPIPNESLPPENISDFYVLDIYRPLQNFDRQKWANSEAYYLAGKIGCIRDNSNSIWDQDPLSQKYDIFLKREFDSLFNSSKLEGGFLESYMDWKAMLPLTYTKNENFNPHICPSGIYDINRNQKYAQFNYASLWEYDQPAILETAKENKSTNFYSLVVIFSSLLFFGVYKRRPRMNENMRKAIKHSYGFFVDLRERRIIPLFNSFWIGAYTALLLATFLSSWIFYYHDSFMVQEIAAFLLQPFSGYELFLRLSSSPLWLTLLLFCLLFFYPIFVSFILKFIATIGNERIRYRQGLAIGLWSGVPLLFILPLSLFSFQLLALEQYQIYLFLILVFFIIWAHFRIVNGIRVLFITRLSKVLIAMLLSYIIPLIIFWAVFKPSTHWLEYLELLSQARSLF